jgi:hypothetical protein
VILHARCLRKVGFCFCFCLERGIAIEVHLCLRSYGFVVGRMEHKTNHVFMVEQLLLMLFFLMCNIGQHLFGMS